MQDKINRVLNLKVCVVDERVERVFDGILSKESNLYIVRDEEGRVMTQFSSVNVKSIKGKGIHVN